MTIFQVENLLTCDEKEKPVAEANGGTGRTNYCLGKDKTPAIFVLDLGCKINVDQIRLVNTHNRWGKDRQQNNSSRSFSVSCFLNYKTLTVAFLASYNTSLWSLCQLILCRLYTSPTGSEPWTKILEKELEDSRQTLDPLPLQLIPVQKTIASQFLKFELVSWWGMGGGLQYFDVQRKGETFLIF